MSAEAEAAPTFLQGDGEVRRQMRAHDWGATPLGAPSAWPESLRLLVSLMLDAPQPMFLAWGEARVMLFNDAYLPVLGERRAGALGRSLYELWPELRSQITPLIDRAFAGEPAQFEDMAFVVHRNGYPEAAYFSFSYTPVRIGGETVCGVLCVLQESTEQVEARERQQFRLELEQRLRELYEPLDIIGAAQEMLGRHLGASRVGWGEVDGEARYFTTERNWTDGSVPHRSGTHDLAGFGPDVWNALKAGVPLVVHDCQADPRTNFPQALAAFEAIDTRAALTASLVRGGRMVAAIYVHDAKPRRWAASQVRLVEEVSERIWSAVERARAELQMGRVREQTDALQRQVETELRESEERLRIAQRAGRIGAFELFPERGEIVVSEEFRRLWGLAEAGLYRTAELLKQIDPEDFKQIGTGRTTLDNQTLEYIEYRIRRADDGEVRWMARRGEVVTDSSGRKRFLGVSYDITDRKQAELALKALNENLEAQVAERTAERDRMWRLSTDVMLVAGFDAKIVAVNPAWTALFGWAAEELIGRPFLDLVHPDDVAATVAEVGRLEEGHTTLRFENRYKGKDGEYRWLSWTAVPDASHIHAVGRDITAEKAAAAELEQTQAALRQAQKMEAVGQLTGGIAHDFNNLLTGVLGSLDLLTRRLQQGRLNELDRYVTAATSSANRAAALTQRLLAFSRRQPLDPRPVDANRLLKGMDELLRRTLGERIELELVAAGGLWTTRCDPHQLESAILNLAINSRDAMPEGGVLTIETCNVRLDDAYAARERQVKPGQYVCIAVTDTGTGIPREIIERVVEPFFTTKPIGQGTGLGLSMIYGFAQQSEGYLKLYSEVGQGTTVKLYLPRFYGSADTAEDDDRVAAPPEPASRNEVVLVVEDENAVRDVVVEVLSELGCRTLEATDGPSGLQVLQSDARIDLLVTDVGLPGLNGRQLADAARAVRPGLKVLFMTGYAENAAAASGFLEPGMEMITKPFALEALTARIQDMLAER